MGLYNLPEIPADADKLSLWVLLWRGKIYGIWGVQNAPKKPYIHLYHAGVPPGVAFVGKSYSCGHVTKITN